MCTTFYENLNCFRNRIKIFNSLILGDWMSVKGSEIILEEEELLGVGNQAGIVGAQATSEGAGNEGAEESHGSRNGRRIFVIGFA